MEQYSTSESVDSTVNGRCDDDPPWLQALLSQPFVLPEHLTDAQLRSLTGEQLARLITRRKEMTPEEFRWRQAPPRDSSLPLSDITNATRFILDHGASVRYCHAWKTWLVWTGTHWERDTTGRVIEWAKESMCRQALSALELDDELRFKAAVKHAKSSMNAGRIESFLKLAQSMPTIPVAPEALDTYPWLLNCPNGVLDLRTGVLVPPDPALYLTKCLPISYDASAECPTWDQFLWRAMGGITTPEGDRMSSEELTERGRVNERCALLVAYLQRAVGYALTGSTREQCLFVLHGPTKTGKSTFLGMIHGMLGAYAQATAMETFMSKEQSTNTNDLAALAGSRYVCALEGETNKRFSEALVKRITGGMDGLTVRFLFEEFFTFRPTFKVFLGTNHKPVIRDSDSAIWERIRLVPFIVEIPLDERDKDLEEKLATEFPGMLAWAVRGCLRWQQEDSLAEPPQVVAATKQYRHEMDEVGWFLDEMCTIGEDYLKTQSSTLLEAFHTWSGHKWMTHRVFTEYLTKKGYEQKRFKTGMFWQKIGLSKDYQETRY